MTDSNEISAMTRLHMIKNDIKTEIIDYHEDGDVFEFTVRTGDTSLFDRKYRGSKSEWKAFFEAQRLLNNIPF